MEIINNTEELRWEVHHEGHYGFLDYKMKGNSMYFIHTEVPKELSGKGVASTIAKTSLAYAKEQGFKIIVYCPYIKAYIERHADQDFGDVEIRKVKMHAKQ